MVWHRVEAMCMNVTCSSLSHFECNLAEQQRPLLEPFRPNLGDMKATLLCTKRAFFSMAGDHT